MLKKASLCAILLCLSVAQEGVDCAKYFEARKEQIELQTREFDEARQSLEAYKASFEILHNQKLQALIEKESEVNATLKRIENLKKENEALLAQTKKLQDSINEKTDGRIKEIYSQMKDSAVANVLSTMDTDEASKIMLSLETRKVSGILSKMEPQKASELTLLLKNLDSNATRE
ncbi:MULTISPECIES: MotE family protein [unclassified Campylobacter]|uniref:MotE family protein n=1 Tax=unclassified Campylobacter TaxID=2593542 RepID=UPI001237DAEA|nr:MULTISPECIES: MotE family protein [unclassified Campylobacter]KAA6227250.1 nucleosidase [Campylobacter sp. LR286c]KAA6227877.1 nucleosidase [Campylobacter sp. LR185c]KAA6228285.1 nucleosidase [Campylobacter sp. LR196d]KAA6229287.1 nucleosidase [Campylobacter sp. LR291e]KAA6231093.1 nucleosidase [Campylobacter sp. LR264d]